MYSKYIIRPLESGISTQYSNLFTPHGFSPFCQNGRIHQKSFCKRWGYTSHRTLGEKVQAIAIFPLAAGDRYTMYLTDTNVAKRESGTGKTFSYLTEAYTTSGIDSISGKTVTGTGTLDWTTAGVAAGDKFILNIAADYTSDAEPNSKWGTIATVGTNSLTLVDNYAGTTGGPWTPDKDYIIRKVYSTPAHERWTYAIVNDHFCFTNGNTDVMGWDGTNYAVALDSTNAKKARYCCEYANRLVIADFTTAVGARMPLSIKYSGEGAPDNWDAGVDPTSGEYDFLESDDYITNIGVVGPNLIVYKRDGLISGYRTGDAYTPLAFSNFQKGIGLVAPYSLIDAKSTNFFLGRSDFYYMDGTQPVPFGDWVRHVFFDLVGETQVQYTWGGHCQTTNEVFWVADTTTGQYAFVFNYKELAWYIYRFASDMSAFGRGAI